VAPPRQTGRGNAGRIALFLDDLQHSGAGLAVNIRAVVQHTRDGRAGNARQPRDVLDRQFLRYSRLIHRSDASPRAFPRAFPRTLSGASISRPWSFVKETRRRTCEQVWRPWSRSQGLAERSAWARCRGRLIQTLKAVLPAACRSGRGVGLHLGPHARLGGPHLAAPNRLAEQASGTG